ncbi:DUF3558 domain-containing protein [Amycolatopsis sp. NBC_01480]|uniref:DUF3558 domain-containing protein n=1 Tax=Amycolatopsis sp. NBC_01480 TaxID=2903562 RepID=UPI002E27F128|nr:DUF3558 domain-containing protein [Amycolatopsis sp. NBC_01480]
MKFRKSLALLGSALLLSGCSDDTGGIATPAPSSLAPVNLTPPYAGAPKVENPLPDSVISGDPCQDALTAEQVKTDVGSGITGKRDSLAGVGATCEWSDLQSGALLKIYFTTKTKLGISQYYDQTQKVAKRFEILQPIQGFPAVAYDTAAAGPESAFCQVAVGISDTADFEVGLSRSDSSKADPCKIAAEIAGDVATTLKQKAGR